MHYFKHLSHNSSWVIQTSWTWNGLVAIHLVFYFINIDEPAVDNLMVMPLKWRHGCLAYFGYWYSILSKCEILIGGGNFLPLGFFSYIWILFGYLSSFFREKFLSFWSFLVLLLLFLLVASGSGGLLVFSSVVDASVAACFGPCSPSSSRLAWIFVSHVSFAHRSCSS